MKVFPGSSGRIILLVVLLLVTCYIADWTEDYNSYYNATRYAAFETANGPRKSVSGGSMFSPSLAAVLATRGSTTAQQTASALDAVFSGPMGMPQSDADDTSMRAYDPFAKRTSFGRLGGSVSGSRLGLSNNSSFGPIESGSGLGSSGSSGMFGGPQ